MLLSMTSFARLEQKETWGTLIWEIKSVNHRYLDVNFKIPEFIRIDECSLREHIRKSLARGKIECSLRIEKKEDSNNSIKINQGLLTALIEAQQVIAKQLNEAAPEQPSTFLKWPGIIETSSVNHDVMQPAVQESFHKAIRQLIDHRQREGVQLKRMIEQRLCSIAEITEQLHELLPNIIQHQQQKLIHRVRDLALAVEPQRLEQEIVLLVQKMDVDEELDRLQAHLIEVKNTLSKGSPCGRRLDFLMQELHREANTLGAKSMAVDSTQASVNLKVLIEQMREQVQNIE